MSDTKAQWQGWAQANIRSPFRKRALRVLHKALEAGQTPEVAMAAAKTEETKRANYMATSALVLGAIGAALGFFLGAVSILTLLFTLASAMQGRFSPTRAWQAWVGLGLAGLGIVFFVLSIALRAAHI